MKKIHYLLPVIFIWLVSCTTKPIEVVEKTYPDSSPKTIRYYSDDSNKELLKEILYYDDGQKKMEGAFENGERKGKWTYWYPNGNKWSEGHYDKGIENGRKTIWHENGQKYYEGALENGQRVGVWRFWSREGELLKEIEYSKK